MLIDFHTHTQPSDELAAEFFEWSGVTTPPHQGTVNDLFAVMNRLSVSRTLIVPWLPAQDLVRARVAAGESREAATRHVLKRWKALNGWATGEVRRFPDRLLCLVGVDPILMGTSEMAAEIALRLSHGACGIKIAPMFLGVAPCDERSRIVWEIARHHGVFILSECGAHDFDGHQAWGHPKYFNSILSEYPDVNVMLAHLGNGAEDEVARLTRAHRNVYTDLSMRLDSIGTPGHWSHREAAEVIRNIGIERVVYGTNYPMIDAVASFENFRALPLTAPERVRLASQNAVTFLARSALSVATPYRDAIRDGSHEH